MRKLRRIIFDIVGAYFFLCITLSSGCISGKLMFHPPRSGYSWQSQDVIRLPSQGGDLAALWYPNPQAPKALLFFHGNAEDIANGVPIFRGLKDAGFSVLAVDYPGFGMSVGEPTEAGAYESADVAYAYLTETMQIASSNIVVMGTSIGSGPACYLAEKHPGIGGLVVQSGFTSAFRTVTRIRLLPVDPFPNMARMRSIECPKLFLHGTQDNTVPYRHSEKLFSVASEPKVLIPVPGAGHNDLPYRMGMMKYFTVIRDIAYSGGEVGAHL